MNCFLFLPMLWIAFFISAFKANAEDGIPAKNIRILKYVVRNGANISPTYEQAVCTELVIGVLKNFTDLSNTDKKRIRIISDTNISILRAQGSQIPKGISYALTESKKGMSIDKIENVEPGDFVQFWNLTWGHCGIVKSIDINTHTMELYSSFPSTHGYGIQRFDIPAECYFVRLK